MKPGLSAGLLHLEVGMCGARKTAETKIDRLIEAMERLSAALDQSQIQERVAWNGAPGASSAFPPMEAVSPSETPAK